MKADLLQIQSEFIKADISLIGAELKSLYDLESAVEYIWQGNKASYANGSLLSFPIIGKLKDDQFRLGNKFYHLIKDGFAKDLKFDLKSKRKDQVSLILSHDKDTLACFPFRFTIVVTYKVYGPKLTMTVEIKNMDKKEMFFSCGFGPAFNLPLSDESYDDYHIEFEHEETRGAYYLDNDLVNFNHADNKKVFDGKKLFLNDEFFNHGEMIFKDIQSESVIYKNRVNEKSIAIDFGNVPYLSIWSFHNARFVRISPSFGVADAVDSNHDFYMKEGIVDLEQEKTLKHSMTFHVR